MNNQEQSVPVSDVVEKSTSRDEIPNSNNYVPSFKGGKQKLIVEGNLKDKIKKLDILHDEKGLDKFLDMYRQDMDKCLLADTYKEYDNMVKLVNKKWECLVDKINKLCVDENPEISDKANKVMDEKFVPALLHFQEIFQVMDNNPVMREGYAETLEVAKSCDVAIAKEIKGSK